MKQPTKAALYMRLSRDDANYGDSVSIETQRTLLRQYAKDNRINVVDEYVDDGWSGTNFERPNFQRMIRDIEGKKINCVITKDLSRFGREHVKMGYYLEFMFPENGVRYIAVTDGEDTEKGLSDFAPFKNLFNEWYAKDCSRKVKAALATKYKAGERISPSPKYGYIKDSNCKNTIIPDPETAWVIKKIFNLATQGLTAGQIAKRLTEERIDTPGWVSFKRYGTQPHRYLNCSEDKIYTWFADTVRHILKDESYIGNTIHYKVQTVSYKNRKRISTGQDKWLKVENTHEGLVSKEVFEEIQDKIKEKRRTRKVGTPSLFCGLLKCADCGWSLYYCFDKKRGFAYYRCGKYATYNLRESDRCTSHSVREDTLKAYVLSRIKFWIYEIQFDEHKVLSLLKGQQDNEEAKYQKEELDKLLKRKNELDNLFVKLYEDWSSGRVGSYNYNMLSQKYEQEQESIVQKLNQLQMLSTAAQNEDQKIEKWVSLIKQFSEPTDLTRELLTALIDKIVVHQAVKQEDGSKLQEIEIFYKFIGKVD